MKHQREKPDKEKIGQILTAEWNRQSVEGPIPKPEDREAFVVMGVLLGVGIVIGMAMMWFIMR